MSLARLSRILRTGFAFAFFGGACVVLTVFSLPWIRFRTRELEERQLRSQHAIHGMQRRFIALMTGTGLMVHRFDGVERLLPGSLIVANHPTLIDAPVILAKLRQLDLLSKDANARNLFMRGAIAGAGYSTNADGAGLIETAAARLRRGRSMLLFPEGTRSPEGSLGPFHRAAAQIALTARIDPIPILITCTPPTLMRGQKWHDVPNGPFEFSLRVGEAIALAPYLEALENGEPKPLVARRLNAELREYFEKALRSQVG